MNVKMNNDLICSNKECEITLDVSILKRGRQSIEEYTLDRFWIYSPSLVIMVFYQNPSFRKLFTLVKMSKQRIALNDFPILDRWTQRLTLLNLFLCSNT